jgi:3-mercaptopyruvate sulfurtransferase SseA
MNPAITDLLDFINREEPSSSLIQVFEVLGHKNVRVISMNLFDWLKRQRRFGNEKPLELRQQYTWCQDLPLMLERWPEMNELLEIKARQLNFRDSMSADERNQIRQIVFERYQPVLMTKKAIKSA